MIIDTKNIIEIPAPETYSCTGCVFAINENGGYEGVCNTQMCGAKDIIFVENGTDLNSLGMKKFKQIPRIHEDSCVGCIFLSWDSCSLADVLNCNRLKAIIVFDG